MDAMNWLQILAVESHGIPGSDWRAQLALPLGIVIFIGSVYLLIRSSLGTRRGYLVMGSSLFGFMVIYAAFWTFGAPGTPPATGPQNLPGQELDAYEDTWRPFAQDSLIAQDPTYAVVGNYPDGFSADPQGAGLDPGFEGEASVGADEVRNFFADGEVLDPALMGDLWAEVESERRYARAENGRPIIAVTWQQTYQVAQVAPGQPPVVEGVQLTPDGERVNDDGTNVAPPDAEIGDIVEDGESYTAFAYFDEGSPQFPSFVTLIVMTILFAVHVALLARDERRERLEREAAAAGAEEAEEPIAVEVGR